MEKQKRWQFFVILTVCVLTLYNILPTVIFYSKPLNAPVDQQQGAQVAQAVGLRVNALQGQAAEWLDSFCSLLHVHPKKITTNTEDPSVVKITFPTDKEAELFARFLPQAGSLIPFVPAQLGLLEVQGDTVSVLRQVGVHFDEAKLDQFFRFTPKHEADGTISDFYFNLTADRFAAIATTLGGPSAQVIELVNALQDREDQDQALVQLARHIMRVSETFGTNSPIAQRYFSSFTQTDMQDSASLLDRLLVKMQEVKTKLELKKAAIQEQRKAHEESGTLIEGSLLELSDQLTQEVRVLESAATIVADNKALFQAAGSPLSRKEVLEWIHAQRQSQPSSDATYTLVLDQRNPLIKELALDWPNDSIAIRLHPDVQAIRQLVPTSEAIKMQQEEVTRLLMNELARVTQVTDEPIVQGLTDFRINLYTLANSSSLLTLDLSKVAESIATGVQNAITNEWKPTHIDLSRDKLPIFDAASFAEADASQKRLCILVVAPDGKETVLPGLRQGSIYVVLRGLQSIIDQYHRFPASEEAQSFGKEIQALATMLQKRGFIGYAAESLNLSPELSRDFIFELDDYYSMLLKATRENFSVVGTKQYASLEFSDVEQRITTENEIEDAIQEDLLRWKESYQAAQVSLDPLARYSVPKPTQNVYWENTKRALKAYFRGDSSKILRWGLDLSGGKSVRISLVDHSGKAVTNPEDLHQAVNELYARINKMGVSDRTIRIENSTIVIDFPGAQGLSATELVKASAMYFHIVNEQFGPLNSALAKDVHEFLQDVWNEAVVTNQKEAEAINQIAYNKLQAAAKRLQGTTLGAKDSAQVLYQAGLRLTNPSDRNLTSAFDDSLSMIARFSDESTEASFQSHPLVITFANYALDGSSLENVQTSYDSSKGNILLFDVRSAYIGAKAQTGANPRDDFFAWTSQFSEEKIMGTSKETYSQGRGWRMAVILNDVVISAPMLNAALRDHAMITGNFTQREVNKLATDLKAGSLSFTPKILSEQNVSPDLGRSERQSGIIASVVAVGLVIITMCSYYRFAGLVACVAVLFNILVIWAVMQNIEVALTLPGIAGVVLTVAMAVDANVLVFERVREEFKISKRISSALQLGYKKAFSAIVDSNLTTVIAALILLQFDSGPIRGFAITLIIGIVSSMFTSLFMTRYFFAGWVQNPANRELKMAEWISATNFNFLKWTKPAFILSAIFLLVGIGVLAKEWKSIFGMDFTGGYSLVVDLDETKKEGETSRELATKALLAKGLSAREFQIRELGRDSLLRIQLGVSLEENGGPFHNMPIESQEPQGGFAYDYEKNPRIIWLLKTLETEGLQVKASEQATLSTSWTHMSGQFSDAMRNNAVMALTLSLLAVLFYIALRFEWKFAFAAVLALMHDVVLTVCVVAIAHMVGLPVQIDLEVIGAIMTIIGYSLNDTIIVFDRVREDMRIMRKKSLAEIINHALNTTLSRTLMTSGTTLLVLLALLFLGGSSIFAFAFVMTVGVFLGTLSSLFIAAPILLFLEERASKSAIQHSHA